MTEYCEHGDLWELIFKFKKFPIELTKFYIAEIVNALEYLRDWKIVHWDLKPENILLDSKWHAKLGDFGESKVIDETKIESDLLEF